MKKKKSKGRLKKEKLEYSDHSLLEKLEDEGLSLLETDI